MTDGTARLVQGGHAGTGLLVYGLTGHWQWTVVALAAPVPFAFLWGRSGRPG